MVYGTGSCAEFVRMSSRYGIQNNILLFFTSLAQVLQKCEAFFHGVSRTFGHNRDHFIYLIIRVGQ